MSSISQTLIAQLLYGARASTYNNSWHVQHAADFIKWASLAPGHRLLDLACGTGLVALPAAKVVEPSGSVTGIDITPEMLAVARQDARTQGLEIDFMQHDITELEGLGLRTDYDAITCASAIPLLEDPGTAITQWATFLKPGGRLVVDVPTERAQLPGLVFEHVAAAVGVQVLFGRRRIAGAEDLERFVRDAGLRVERSFVADGYGSANVYSKDQGGELFDRMVAGPVGQLYPMLRDDAARRARARTLYIRDFANLAGLDGMLREEEGFYIVVGVKM